MLLLEHSQSSPHGRLGWLPRLGSAFALTLTLLACDSPPLYPMPARSGVMMETGGALAPDMFTAADGQPCMADGDCESDHCNHQICCASGDCCLSETDCTVEGGTASVCDDESSCQGTRGAIMCSKFRCRVRDGVEDDSACDKMVEADDCGPYVAAMCTGEVIQDQPKCFDGCADDSQCDPEAHCDAGACVPDTEPGGDCMASNECSTNYCNRGVCCAAGDCCREDGDCDAGLYTTPAVCQDTTTCQGVAGRPSCQASQCTVAMADDDSGCDRTVIADFCGDGGDVHCRGGADQGPPPPCATGTCAAGLFTVASCNEEAFCWQGDCIPDQPNGEGCTVATDCQSGNCSNNVCCDPGGDCCENDSQCPAKRSCVDQVMCQGTRQERYCDMNSGTCANGMVIDDDSGCGMMMSTRECGDNLQPTCSAQEDQADAPPCPRCTNLPRCAASHRDERMTPRVCPPAGEEGTCTGGDIYYVTVCDVWVNDIPVNCVPGARCNSGSGECYD
jgi:hypothetical protein